MPVYTSASDITSRPVVYTPVREVRLTKTGALLMAADPRYSDLPQYVDQFGAPLSSLKAQGLWTFADPIADVSLLVECEAQPYCERCTELLPTCHCLF